jgi:hypothetical protein
MAIGDSLVETAYTPVVLNPKKTVSRRSNPLLSKCSAHYAFAIAHPFHPSSRSVCNPNFSAPLSSKCAGVGGFDIAIGTAGIGWILFSPNFANDGICAYYTNASYTGSVASPFSANNTLNTGVTAQAPGWMPYSTSSFKNGTSPESGIEAGACVVMGVRATYTGQWSTLGGMIYCYHSPDHQSVSGMAPSDVLSRPETEVRGVSKKPCEFRIHDALLSESEGQGPNFNSTPVQYYPYSQSASFATTYRGSTAYTYTDGGSVSAGVPVAAIFFVGTAGNTFHIDVCSHFEFVGQQPSYLYTARGNDRVGAGQVISAALGVPERLKSDDSKDWYTHLREGIVSATEASAEIALPVLAEALAAALIR